MSIEGLGDVAFYSDEESLNVEAGDLKFHHLIFTGQEGLAETDSKGNAGLPRIKSCPVAYKFAPNREAQSEVTVDAKVTISWGGGSGVETTVGLTATASDGRGSHARVEVERHPNGEGTASVSGGVDIKPGAKSS